MYIYYIFILFIIYEEYYRINQPFIYLIKEYSQPYKAQLEEIYYTGHPTDNDTRLKKMFIY